MINLALVMVGITLVLIGSLRAIISDKSYLEDPSANHADKRIIQEDGLYWTQQYHAFPGWSLDEHFRTLEEAKASKAQWDLIHKRVEKTGPTVVVPQ